MHSPISFAKKIKKQTILTLKVKKEKELVTL